MKKGKIILLTIAVIAIVGTALAFKLNKFGIDTYCYLETFVQPSDGSCTNVITNAIAVSTGQHTYYYTLKPAGGNCANQSLGCPFAARSFAP